VLQKRKERKRIYIVPFIYYVYLKALRHGSHSFTCKYTMPASRLIIQEMVLKWHQHLMSMSFYLSMNGNNYTEIVKHALFIENKRKPVTGNYEVKSEFITTGPASEDQTKPSDQEYALHGEDQDCNVWYLNPSETKNEVLRPQPSFPSPNQQC